MQRDTEVESEISKWLATKNKYLGHGPLARGSRIVRPKVLAWS